MKQHISVFISATSKGLKNYRHSVARAVRELGHRAVEQTDEESFPPDYREIKDVLRHRMGECDMVICLIGPVYGLEPTKWPDERMPRRSYTQLEHDFALEWQKPVFRYIASDDCPLDYFDAESEIFQQRQKEYKKSFERQDHIFYTFSSEAELLGLLPRNSLVSRIIPNLPFPKLEDGWFQGRNDAIATIKRNLKTRPAHIAAVTAKQTIHGLGGVGKTRLLLEYAYQHASEYIARLYVSADSRRNLHSKLAALCHADVLDLPEKESNKENDQVKAVLNWLNNHPGWLLILDNVDTDEAAVAVRGVIGDLKTGHVLIASRLTNWTGVDVVELDVLSQTASVDFLLIRTAEKPGSPTGRKRLATETDKDDAGILAVELGCLPLALEQAGAYIAKHTCSFLKYLERFKKVQREVLWFDSSLTGYSKCVATTWQTSVNELGDDSRTLLNTLAWLAPDAMPRNMILQQPPDSPEREGPLANLEEAFARDNTVINRWIAQPIVSLVNRLRGRKRIVAPPIANREIAIRALADYSLASESNRSRTISVHRLVQDVTRLKIADNARRGYVDGALRLVFQYAPLAAHIPSNWDVWNALSPHVSQIIRFAREYKIENPTDQLMNMSGSYLQNAKSEFEAAEDLFRESLTIAERRWGRNSLPVAPIANNLATVLRERNKPDEIENLFNRALTIAIRYFGPINSTAAEYSCNLGSWYSIIGNDENAKKYLRQSMAILQIMIGLQNGRVETAEDLKLIKDLSIAHVELARCLEKSDPLSATQHYCDAIQIQKTYFGPNHYELALTYSNAAGLMQKKWVSISNSDKEKTEYEGVIEWYFEKALQISEHHYGPNHPDVALCLNNLACFLHLAGRSSEAVLRFERALTIELQIYSADDPRIIRHRQNLEIARRAAGI